MHRFDERRALEQLHARMDAHVRRAARERALRELRRSRPPLRRRLAHALIGLAERLEPGALPRADPGRAAGEARGHGSLADRGVRP